MWKGITQPGAGNTLPGPASQEAGDRFPGRDPLTHPPPGFLRDREGEGKQPFTGYPSTVRVHFPLLLSVLVFPHLNVKARETIPWSYPAGRLRAYLDSFWFIQK